MLWAPPTLRPEVAAAAADGLVEFSELRGTPVVLNFWASWCAPCREEAPLLSELSRTRGASISMRSESNEVSRSYGLTGVPET